MEKKPLAGREFIGEKWLGFLNDNQIRYHIRLRNNFKVFSYQKRQEIQASWMFNGLKLGKFYHHRKIVRLYGQDCYLPVSREMDRDGAVEYLILVSFYKAEISMETYQKRWQVEALSRALKSSGFNIEDTHVTELERLQKLFLLTMIVFVWCYKIGDYIDGNIQKIKI